jgi:hypothetical protein
MMRPGQLEPNEFELTILERMATRHPALREHLGQLHVLSRNFTGVGCFTTFVCVDSDSKSVIHMDGLVHVPTVPNGLGAVLFCRGGHPECLEVFSFGEPWDGTFDGFSLGSVPEEPQ